MYIAFPLPRCRLFAAMLTPGRARRTVAGLARPSGSPGAREHDASATASLRSWQVWKGKTDSVMLDMNGMFQATHLISSPV